LVGADRPQPTSYLAHFLGHEGRGSVLSYLKKQGWVNGLSAGSSHGSSGFDFFKVSVDLTPDGLGMSLPMLCASADFAEHYEDVALAIFKYISLLRSTPASSTVFNEIQAIGDISFKFAERGRTSDYVCGLSGWMQSPVPREKIVSSKYLLEEFDVELLTNATQLLDPRRAVIGVTCQTLPSSVQGTFDRKEPIYGTEYKLEKVSEKFLKEVSAITSGGRHLLMAQALTGASISDLQLPGPNLFIPEKLDVEKLNVTEVCFENADVAIIDLL
jgi:insulysin